MMAAPQAMAAPEMMAAPQAMATMAIPEVLAAPQALAIPEVLAEPAAPRSSAELSPAREAEKRAQKTRPLALPSPWSESPEAPERRAQEWSPPNCIYRSATSFRRIFMGV